MRLYAIPADLIPNYANVVPAGANSLILHASLLVEKATTFARYEVDDDGYPTNEKIAAGFRAATCFQAAAWSAAGIDPNRGAIGQELRVASQSAGGGSVSYVGVASNEDVAKALTTLCDASVSALEQVGLLNRKVGYL